jgi:hypothetical protein
MRGKPHPVLTTLRQKPAADFTRVPSTTVRAGTYTVNGLNCPTEVITVTNAVDLTTNITSNAGGDYTYILEGGVYVLPLTQGGSRLYLERGRCRSQTYMLLWQLCLTHKLQTTNQSINVTPVAMKLKKLMPAIH